MTTVPPVPARLPAYDLVPPCEADALASLGRVFGDDRATSIWRAACSRAAVAPGRVSLADLPRVADALGAEGGAAVAIARSIHIRLRTYVRLSEGRAALDRLGSRP